MSPESDSWLREVSLPPRAESAIATLFPSQDPLDAADFDPVAYLNAHFPTESSLENLDAFLARTSQRAAHLEAEVRAALSAAALDPRSVDEEVDAAAQAIRELFDKVSSIRAKADESEQMVQELCADVKQLDRGKRNLTATFAALKRLHMLSSAVDQLQSFAEHRQYGEAGNLLDAVGDLFREFEGFKQIRKVDELRARVEESRRKLEEAVLDDFRMVGGSLEGATGDVIRNLKSACEVLDALGEEPTKRLVRWISAKQLEAYVAIYEPIQGANYRDPNTQAGVANIERRYTWLRRQLQKFVAFFSPVFPKEWNVAGRICVDFCLMTHQHLLVVLNETREQGALDIQLLVKQLQRTISFEEELERYYSKVAHVLQCYEDDPDKFEDFDPNSSEAIKRKYREQKQQDNAPKSESQLGEDKRKKKSGWFAPQLVFKGLISKSFAEFMSEFIHLERTNIQNLIEKIIKEEDWSGDNISASDDSHSSAVEHLHGADELFHYIKRSIKNCSKLDTRKVFFDICLEYKKGLRAYAVALRSRLPKQELVSNLKAKELAVLSRIISTAEYCAKVTPDMKETLTKTIDPIYAEKIDFDDEEEEFKLLINSTIELIVAFFAISLDPALSLLEKMNWATWESVGDTSSYVGEVKMILQTHLSLIVNKISQDYHNYLCRKLIETLVPKFLNAICRCKRINEAGAQQLLLDAQELESLMEKIPRIGLDPKNTRRIPGIFSKLVKKEMGKAVVILKTIACPADTTGETYRSLIRNGSFADLAKIMDLKGMKKSEQQPIIEAYNSKVPQAQQMAAFLRDDSKTSVSSNPASIFQSVGFGKVGFGFG